MNVSGMAKSLWAGWARDLPGRHSNLRAEYIPTGMTRDPLSPMLQPVRNLAAQNRFEEAVALIERFRTNEIYSWSGRPLSNYAAHALTGDFVADTGHEAANIARLEHIRAWQARAPHCPYAAAALADACASTAHSIRGCEFANKVTKEQWAGHAVYANMAHEALLAAYPLHKCHWYWARIYFGAALTTGEQAGEHTLRFTAAFNAAPFDPSNYRTLAHALLPRWYGSFAMIEANAAWISDQTQSRLGQAAYAMMYELVAEYDDLPSTDADWDRLHRGFTDWFAAFPSDRVRTAHASAAVEYDQLDIFRDVAESADRIYEDQWAAPLDFYTANSLARTFTSDR